MLTASANPLPESSDFTLRGFGVSSSIWTLQDRTRKQEHSWAMLPQPWEGSLSYWTGWAGIYRGTWKIIYILVVTF